jgi:hypothetical protein
MDQQRFDDMVRTLSERNSRRGALRLLTGGIFGALVGVPTVGALAKPKKKKKEVELREEVVSAGLPAQQAHLQVRVHARAMHRR